jgi:nucleoside-diphosphate-sugar epimerase
MKVAVTGASGFIGRHVLDALQQHGDCEIIAVTRARTEPGQWPSNARVVALDIAKADDSVFEQLDRPDLLIHLAWSGLPNYLSNHHFEDELPAQYRFLRAMVDAGLRSMLITGTCFEYGMQSGALDEEMVAAPANPYAFAKASLLQQLNFLQADAPFALTWARLFYTFGPGQSPKSIYSLLQSAVENGDASFPMSKGEQLRDFLPVEKIARIIVALALQRANHGIVNICSGEPVSIRGLVEQWIEENGWQIALELGKFPYPSYEPLAFWGSANRLRQILPPSALVHE